MPESKKPVFDEDAWNESAIANLKRVLKKKLGRKITRDEQAYLDGFTVTGVPPKRDKKKEDAEMLEAVSKAAARASDPKRRRDHKVKARFIPVAAADREEE